MKNGLDSISQYADAFKLLGRPDAFGALSIDTSVGVERRWVFRMFYGLISFRQV